MVLKAFLKKPLFWMALAGGLGIFVSRIFHGELLFSFVGMALFAAIGFHYRLRVLGILGVLFFGFFLYSNLRDILPPAHLLHFGEEFKIPITLKGKIVQEPALKIRKNIPVKEFIFEAEKLQLEKGWQNVHGRILVQTPSLKDFDFADEIQFTAEIKRPPPPMNPGTFDYRSYLANKRIHFLARPEKIQISQKKKGFFLRELALKFRRHMIQVTQIPPWRQPKKIGNIKLAPHEEIGALTSAMLMGYRDGLTEELNDSFKKTGTLHLFAVSGQNVAALTGLLILILQVLGIIHWRWSWILIPVILLFCLATGMEPSAFRTFLMMTLLFIGWAIHRPVNPLNILGCAAIIIWLWEPRQIFDVGFQFSFVVVLTLLIFTKPINDWLYRWLRPDPWIPERLLSRARRMFDFCYRIFCTLAAVSIAAWIGALPISLIYFHNIIPVTPVANLFVAIPANLVVMLSVMSVCVGWISLFPVMLINQINWFLLQGIILVVQFLAHVPGGHFYASPYPEYWWKATPQICVLYSGNSSPAVLQYQNKKWLIDAGSEFSWKYVIDPERRQRGVNQWDGVVITQSNKAHVQGVFDIVKECPSPFYAESGFYSRSFLYRDWRKLTKKEELKRILWRKGKEIELCPKIMIEVLWPPKKPIFKNAGDNSLVFFIRANGKSILWASSISQKVEKLIMKENPVLQADVLIQSSAQNKKNLSREWLEAVHPEYLIRPEMRFGFDYSLENIRRTAEEELRIKIVPMSKTGAVTIDLGEEALLLRTFR